MINLGIENEKLEFKKNTGELKEGIISICSILNKHGEGELYFGVKNNGDIIGQQIGTETQKDISRKIYESLQPIPVFSIEIIVASDNQFIKVTFSGDEKPYKAFGKYYIRNADEDRELTIKQLEQMFFSGKNVYSKWETQVLDKDSSQINFDILNYVYQTGFNAKRIDWEMKNPEVALKKFELTKNGKLNNAGYHLFSNEQPVELRLGLFATEDKTTALNLEIFKGNIFECIKRALEFISSNIRWKAVIKYLEREDIPEIPIDAIREIIVNSFCHANFNNVTSSHEIDIFSNRIRIFNPGYFPFDITPKEFAKGEKTSIIRNPLISEVLFRSTFIERFGTGFQKVYTLCNANNIITDYKINSQGFYFEFYRPLLAIENNIIKEIKLNASELGVLNQLKKNPELTISELSIILKKSDITIKRSQSSLKSKGFIERIGSDRGGHWKILK